jgi:hypothetical protein
MIVGLGGNNGTTFVAGVVANREYASSQKKSKHLTNSSQEDQLGDQGGPHGAQLLWLHDPVQHCAWSPFSMFFVVFFFF